MRVGPHPHALAPRRSKTRPSTLLGTTLSERSESKGRYPRAGRRKRASWLMRARAGPPEARVQWLT
jgi:hypothetical protein